jgi:hypothetical protein
MKISFYISLIFSQSKYNIFILLIAGHREKVQFRKVVFLPTQLGPPNCGAGLLQSLVRKVMPLPHVTEHAEKLPHAPHFPAEIEKGKNLVLPIFHLKHQ